VTRADEPGVGTSRHFVKDWEQTQSGRQLVYAIDAHWTPAGHQVAAEYLLGSVLFQRDP